MHDEKSSRKTKANCEQTWGGSRGIVREVRVPACSSASNFWHVRGKWKLILSDAEMFRIFKCSFCISAPHFVLTSCVEPFLSRSFDDFFENGASICTGLLFRNYCSCRAQEQALVDKSSDTPSRQPDAVVRFPFPSQLHQLRQSGIGRNPGSGFRLLGQSGREQPCRSLLVAGKSRETSSSCRGGRTEFWFALQTLQFRGIVFGGNSRKMFSSI